MLSHLGSGAEIMMLMIDAATGGPPIAPEAMPEIWAQWNAKEPQQQAADYQVADERLVNRWESLGPDELERFRAELGPWKLSAAEAAGMRLNEHVLHAWDIQVALEPSAILPEEAAALLLTRLGWMAGFAGKGEKWDGAPVRLAVRVTDPDERLLLEIGEKVQVSGVDDTGVEDAGVGGDGDVSMPAEALIRLFYGRLDDEHMPDSVSVTGPVALDDLRRVFPGL